MVEPLTSDVVRRLINEAMENDDNWDLSIPHGVDEMFKDGFMLPDVGRCLRGGVVYPGELRKATYRYRVATTTMIAVVAFTSLTRPIHFVVVTVMRNKKGTLP